jgi:trehalose monomycolate/heme transporter
VNHNTQHSNRQGDIAPLITSPTLQVMVGGNVPVNIAINSQVSADLERAEMITLPIVVFLLLIVFSGLVAAALPLLIGGVTILGAFAVLRVLTGLTDVSVFAIQVVTMLGLGLGIDYSLFVVTRFREELKFDENDVRGALQRTMATAGRTILFSGLTVSTSLLSLLLFPEFFLRSMGMGSIAATLVALLASLTLLPAVLALLGKRVNALSIQRLFRRTSSRGTVGPYESRGTWYRLSQAVMRWPVPVALVVVAILSPLRAGADCRCRFCAALLDDRLAADADQSCHSEYAFAFGNLWRISLDLPGWAPCRIAALPITGES